MSAIFGNFVPTIKVLNMAYKCKNWGKFVAKNTTTCFAFALLR